jgi:AraC-like DNA-binding protein
MTERTDDMTKTPRRQRSAGGPSPTPDVLSDVLGLLSLRGEVFCRTELSAPWGMFLSRHSAHFHVIERGSVWFQLEKAKRPFETVAGDLVVLPHGHGHRMMDRPGRKAVPLEQILPQQTTPSLLRYGGGGAATHVICGTFRIGGLIADSMMAVLPAVIHVPGASARHFAWLDLLLRLLAEESQSTAPGSRFATSRMVDLLLVLVVRYWLAEQPQPRGGWLAGLRDQRIAAALAHMHGAPERAWDVVGLASAVGMSRSSFTERFTTIVGESPLQYLTRWRVQLAARWLEAPGATVGEVAERVGYRSEAAFSRVFKRHLGAAPTLYRHRPT